MALWSISLLLYLMRILPVKTMQLYCSIFSHILCTLSTPRTLLGGYMTSVDHNVQFFGGEKL